MYLNLPTKYKKVEFFNLFSFLAEVLRIYR
nr:MAG TPA: hypothetical protein [Caudoviricetes sp.]